MIKSSSICLVTRRKTSTLCFSGPNQHRSFSSFFSSFCLLHTFSFPLTPPVPLLIVRFQSRRLVRCDNIVCYCRLGTVTFPPGKMSHPQFAVLEFPLIQESRVNCCVLGMKKNTKKITVLQSLCLYAHRTIRLLGEIRLREEI